MRRHFIISILFLTVFSSWLSSAQNEISDKRMENLILDAVVDYEAARYSAAREKLHGVISIQPQNDAAHYYMGMSEYMSGNYAAAVNSFRKAAEIDKNNFWYRYRLAAAYAAIGESDLTAEIYNELLKDFPKKNDLYYVLVELYLSMGKMDLALETLDQIETVFGKNEISVMTRFDILRRLERQREAFEVLEEYNKDNSSLQILTILGDYQMSMYNDSTALAYYNEALDIASDYAPALLGKAETYRMTRKYDEYFKTLAQFIANKDIPSEGKGNYLTVLVQKSDPNFIRKFTPNLDSVVANYIIVHPHDTTANTLAGLYYYRTERRSEAKKYFADNLKLQPESLKAAANYAEFLAYSSEWEELAEYSKETFVKFPKEYGFMEYATLAYYNLKEYDEVLDVCKTMVNVAEADSARSVTAYTTMGDIYFMKDEKKLAYASYDKALKINPQHAPVLNNYAYYLSMEGKKLKKAYNMSKKTVEIEPDNPTYLDTFGWILFLQGKSLEAKPFFKHAMLYGGKESAVILDHYAEVLYDLGEYDLAFLYWNQALGKDKNGEIPGLEAKIKVRKDAMKKKR